MEPSVILRTLLWFLPWTLRPVFVPPALLVLVVPIPTRPDALIFREEVPAAVLLPVKYATCPIEPVRPPPPVDRQVPLTAKHPLAMLMPPEP